MLTFSSFSIILLFEERRRERMLKKLLFVISIVMVSFSFSAKAENARFYYGMGVGVNKSPDTSNDNSLEFGSEPGYSILAFMGHDFDYWKYRMEFDVRTQNFHGYNNSSGNFSLDGHKLDVYGVSLGLFGKYRDFSLGPVIGYSLMNGLGEYRGAWFWGGEISYEYRIDNHSSLEFGYRYFRWQKLDNFGNKGKLAYDTHGPTVRFVYRP